MVRKIFLFILSIAAIISAHSQANEVPTDNPRSAVAWYKHGVSKLEAHDYAASIPYFTKAISLDPRYVDAYYARGGVEMQLRLYWACIHDMDTALSLDPKCSKCYLVRGADRFAMLNGAFSYANDSAAVIADMDSGCTDVHMADQLGEKNAKAYIEEYCPEAVMHLLKAMNMVKLKQRKEAIAEFDKSIALDSKSGFAYYQRAISKLEMKQTDGACADFRQANELGNTEAAEMIHKYCK